MSAKCSRKWEHVLAHIMLQLMTHYSKSIGFYTEWSCRDAYAGVRSKEWKRLAANVQLRGRQTGVYNIKYV